MVQYQREQSVVRMSAKSVLPPSSTHHEVKTHETRGRTNIHTGTALSRGMLALTITANPKKEIPVSREMSERSVYVSIRAPAAISRRPRTTGNT